MKHNAQQWLRGGDCSRCAHRGAKCRSRCEPKEEKDMAVIKKLWLLSVVREREGYA